jgi:hypothetical protein
MRRGHPGWGPDTLAPQSLTKAGLMGERAGILALPAYPLALSFIRAAWRQLESARTLAAEAVFGNLPTQPAATICGMVQLYMLLNALSRNFFGHDLIHARSRSGKIRAGTTPRGHPVPPNPRSDDALRSPSFGGGLFVRVRESQPARGWVCVACRAVAKSVTKATAHRPDAPMPDLDDRRTPGVPPRHFALPAEAAAQ